MGVAGKGIVWAVGGARGGVGVGVGKVISEGVAVAVAGDEGSLVGEGGDNTCTNTC